MTVIIAGCSSDVYPMHRARVILAIAHIELCLVDLKLQLCYYMYNSGGLIAHDTRVLISIYYSKPNY